MRGGEDITARLGGDEFVVMLYGVTELEQARAIAEQIRLAILQPFDLENRQLRISVSIGIAFHAAGGAHTPLLSDADAAMYTAKREGGNRLAMAPEPT